MEIGLIGALFILSAWVYETYRALEKGERLNIKFVLVYLVGNILLTYHAITIQDTVFIILNGAIGIMSLIELELALRRIQKKKRKRSSCQRFLQSS
ncbi:MAG: hypothetical protein AABX14_05995 [Candidatus Aenigmatarchaeota archaeon]